jgi:transposase
MYYATESRRAQILVWLIWAIACLVVLSLPEAVVMAQQEGGTSTVLAGVVTQDPGNGPLFPWQLRYRWRRWIWRRYKAWQRARRRAVWIARLGRLAMVGALSLAHLVDLASRSQLRRHMGALPVLYALLETLQVRHVINRHCPTRAKVDHGTVAMVLVLNRLLMPLPLYQVADWLARTVLVYTLGIPAARFNDDRLARTLDAIQPHCRTIWQEVVQQALQQAEIDLRFIFYDLTAFIVHGTYSQSQHVDFGFANNTPMKKRKFKAGLNVTADGNLPIDYSLWSGRTTDMATVEENMTRLGRLLRRHGWSSEKVTIVGDRANLSDKLALTYDDHNLHYLAGLRLLKKVHRALLVAAPESHFYAYPLIDEPGPKGYWGLLCRVPFEYEGRQATHKGLVVLSGPMRTAIRRGRAKQFRELHQALQQVQAQIGQPRCRTVKAVQHRARTKLKSSPVGKLMHAQAYTDEQGQVCLRWWVDADALRQKMERDGRYLLVTNNEALSAKQMLALYHQKDGVEKRICVSKNQLKVSPIYLHKDERIEAMLLINMLALLTYSLLERQVRQGGLQMTTRRIIEKLHSLDVVETCCWDGSYLLRLVPLDDEQIMLLQVLAPVLAELRTPRWSHLSLPTRTGQRWSLPPPRDWYPVH